MSALDGCPADGDRDSVDGCSRCGHYASVSTVNDTQASEGSHVEVDPSSSLAEVRPVRIFSTYHAPLRAVWRSRVDTPSPGLSKLGRALEILRRGRRYPCVVVDGSEREGLLYAAALARAPRAPTVVIIEATWKLGRSLLDRSASKLGLPALYGSRTYYCVLSTAEVEWFPRTWGVSPERVALTPYHYTLSDDMLAMQTATDGRIFAGGDSLRDHGLLIDALRDLPHPALIATRTPKPEWLRALPSHVEVSGVSEDAYIRETARAPVVVVPLESRSDRSAGQATYLNAMALGKPVIVTDAAGARDHIRADETGVIVPCGDRDALRAALRRVLEDRAYAQSLGEAARRDVLERFSPDRYVERILEVADLALLARNAEPCGGLGTQS
jgi:glycosyltransferase involved in cell wall biosynthesis